MRGIIDQIELDAESRAIVVEHKTRFNPSLPSHAQKRTAKLQVQLALSLMKAFQRKLSSPLPSPLLHGMVLTLSQTLYADGCT